MAQFYASASFGSDFNILFNQDNAKHIFNNVKEQIGYFYDNYDIVRAIYLFLPRYLPDELVNEVYLCLFKKPNLK